MMQFVGSLVTTLVVGLAAAAVGAVMALVMARRRGVTVPVGRLRTMILLLVAVVVISTLAAPYLSSSPQTISALDIFEAVGGVVLAGYAFRSWQRSGWTSTTQSVAIGAVIAFALLALDLFVR